MATTRLTLSDEEIERLTALDRAHFFHAATRASCAMSSAPERLPDNTKASCTMPPYSSCSTGARYSPGSGPPRPKEGERHREQQ